VSAVSFGEAPVPRLTVGEIAPSQSDARPHYDQVDRTGVCVQNDDFGRISVLLDRLHPHTRGLSALTKLRRAVEPLSRATRER
jgi:hypothetical protein